MHQHWIEIERCQHVGQLVLIETRNEVSWRTLQHGHMLDIVSNVRNDSRCRGSRSDHHNALALIIKIFRPMLRMDNGALELVHALPLGRIAFFVIVIA